MSLQRWKPFLWLNAPWKLHGFTLPVGTWLVRGCTQTTASISLHVGAGETGDGSQLRASSHGRSRNEVFYRNFEYSPNHESGRPHFLYSTCKRQARRKSSTLAIRCGGQARVESTTKPALYMYSSSSQIHADTSSTTHTERRSRLECSCFPQPQAFVSDPRKPRTVVRRYYARSTTWQLVMLGQPIMHDIAAFGVRSVPWLLDVELCAYHDGMELSWLFEHFVTVLLTSGLLIYMVSCTQVITSQWMWLGRNRFFHRLWTKNRIFGGIAVFFLGHTEYRLPFPNCPGSLWRVEVELRWSCSQPGRAQGTADNHILALSRVYHVGGCWFSSLSRSTACPLKDIVKEFNVCFVEMNKGVDRVQIEGVFMSHMLWPSTISFTEDKLSQTTGSPDPQKKR